MTEIPDNPIFPIRRVAFILGVHVSTIRRWIEEERIKAIRLPTGRYRIPRGEVVRILEGRGGQSYEHIRRDKRYRKDHQAT